jgi:hypothetical protein
MKWKPLVLAWSLSVFAGMHAWPVETLEPSEATPGRAGVCVTEMDGGERVEIPLTVLGTVGSGTPDGEIVIVRLDHPRLRETGIIAGMSGSPVYIDGKLLGALAYGFAFASEPIGGVTPFVRMLEIEGSAPMSGMATQPTFPEILEAAGNGELGDLVVDWLVPAGSEAVMPLPLAVAGWRTPPEGSWLAESWRRMGWVASTGGGSQDAEVTDQITPGSMVGAVMVDGDVTLAAGGTVTEVRDDHLWAFGHPSLGTGTTRMPLARAGVVAVVPSLMNSFKLFTVGEPIGAIVADRRDGIVGRLGEEAPMIPVSVVVDGDAYSFRTVRHPALTPLLAGYLTYATHGIRGRAFGEQTVAARVSVRYPDFEAAAASATFSGNQAATEASAFATAVVAYLEGSPFQGPQIESLDISLETVERLEAATIIDIVPERRVVHPGEELQVQFRLRPHRGPELSRALILRIPEGMPEGRLDLVGADGAAWSSYDLQMRPLHPASFADEIRLVNSLQSSTTLVAVLERRDVGMTVPGGTVSAPPSIVMQMQQALGPNLDTVGYTVFAMTETEMPFPVSGAQRIPLTVRAGSREPEMR